MMAWGMFMLCWELCVFFKCEGFAVLLICCLYLFSSLNLFLLVFMVVAYFMSPLRKLLDVSFN